MDSLSVTASAPTPSSPPGPPPGPLASAAAERGGFAALLEQSEEALAPTRPMPAPPPPGLSPPISPDMPLALPLPLVELSPLDVAAGAGADLKALPEGDGGEQGLPEVELPPEEDPHEALPPGFGVPLPVVPGMEGANAPGGDAIAPAGLAGGGSSLAFAALGPEPMPPGGAPPTPAMPSAGALAAAAPTAGEAAAFATLLAADSNQAPQAPPPAEPAMPGAASPGITPPTPQGSREAAPPAEPLPGEALDALLGLGPDLDPGLDPDLDLTLAPAAAPGSPLSGGAEAARWAAGARDALPAPLPSDAGAALGGPIALTDASPAEVSRAEAPAPPAPPPPARQVAPLAVALAFAPALGQFSVALDPPQLGRVEIAVTREGEGHQVRILAERPETLALLERDRGELDRALAEAGVAVGEGGLRFALAGDSGGGGQPSGGREGEAGRFARPAPAGPAAGAASPGVPARGLLDLRI